MAKDKHQMPVSCPVCGSKMLSSMEPRFRLLRQIGEVRAHAQAGRYKQAAALLPDLGVGLSALDGEN